MCRHLKAQTPSTCCSLSSQWLHDVKSLQWLFNISVPSVAKDFCDAVSNSILTIVGYIYYIIMMWNIVFWICRSIPKKVTLVPALLESFPICLIKEQCRCQLRICCVCVGEFEEGVVVSHSGCFGALTCWQSPSGDNEKDAYAKHARPSQPRNHTTITAGAYTTTPVRAAFEIPPFNESWHSTFPQCFLRGREEGRVWVTVAAVTSVIAMQSRKISLSPLLRMSDEALRFVCLINNVIWFARRRSAAWPQSSVILDLTPLAGSCDALTGCDNFFRILSAQTCISYFMFWLRYS